MSRTLLININDTYDKIYQFCANCISQTNHCSTEILFLKNIYYSRKCIQLSSLKII